MKMENRKILNYIMFFVLFALLLKYKTGTLAHEILGVGFVILIAVHCFNNRAWLRNILKTNRQKKGPQKQTRLIVINCLLFLSFVLAVTNGVMLSVILFRFLDITYKESFYIVHVWSVRALFVFSMTHLLINKKSRRGI